jgi:putative tryptophan/tyrosine transport system substrate-binding protein
MKYRWALAFTVFGVLLVAVPAEAQQPGKVWHLGILWGGPHTGGLVATSFLEELQKLGYAEGRNLAIEWRWAEAREQKLPALAAELVDANVDVIVAGGAAAVIAAKQVTTTVPIVMEINSDPVETGLVASYARPGGNVTGFSPITHELAGKRLEILTEAVPGIRRVAALLDPIPAQVPHIREVQSASQALGLHLQPFEVRSPGDFAAAFAAVTADRPDAMLILGSPTTVIYRAQIIGFTAQARLPAMYDKREFMIDGGLMGYFPSRLEQARSTAAYVDKILKGAKPNDLPIEQPTRFELVVNLKTAAALGLTIPPSILGRADEVLE